MRLAARWRCPFLFCFGLWLHGTGPDESGRRRKPYASESRRFWPVPAWWPVASRTQAETPSADLDVVREMRLGESPLPATLDLRRHAFTQKTALAATAMPPSTSAK